MNISGILVVVSPSAMDATVEALTAMPGVDVHHTEAGGGRIVVTQEAESIRDEVDGLKRIKELPGIILAEMVYHNFEGDDEIIDSLPPELGDQDEAVGVPSYLRD